MIVTIAVGIEDRPASAPRTDTPWASDFKIFGNPSFVEGITAISNLTFAFSGTPGFFSIVSEMRNPRRYTPALLICQAGVTSIYTVVACVVYYYCGSYVASPALGSAGGSVKKISYGIALPGLVVTTTIVIHVGATGIQGTKDVTGYSLILRVDTSKVHLCSTTPWLPTSEQQYPNSLDILARLYLWYHRDRIYHCQYYSRIQRTGVSHWRLAGHDSLFSTIRLYVVV